MLYLRRPQKIRDNALLVRQGFRLGVVFVRGFSADGRSPLYSSWPEYPARCRHDQPLPKLLLYRNGEANRVKALQQMTPALPLGHELEAEWRFRVIRYAGGCGHGRASYTPFDTREPMPEKRGSPHYVQLDRTESCKTRIYPPAQDRYRLICIPSFPVLPR